MHECCKYPVFSKLSLHSSSQEKLSEQGGIPSFLHNPTVRKAKSWGLLHSDFGNGLTSLNFDDGSVLVVSKEAEETAGTVGEWRVDSLSTA